MNQRSIQWGMSLVIFVCAAVAILLGKVLNPYIPWFLYIILVVIGFFVHAVILVLQTDQSQKSTDTHLKKKA